MATKETVTAESLLREYHDLLRNGAKRKHFCHVALPHGWNGYEEFEAAVEALENKFASLMDPK